ncbi:MAG: RluA family pseudouridine synthase [Opitutaceae bacterium]|nr:RluA family pseudouridine synthase [Opitutaceae bacterium]
MNTVPNPHGYPKPIGPWERRLRQGVVRQIAPWELASWICFEDERVLVVEKPGDVVCHPSKEGPWSSLAGAVREHRGGDTASHLVFRLDRETSGLVIFAKTAAIARQLQMAVQERRYTKEYLVVLTGSLRDPVSVDQPLGPDEGCPVTVKSSVRTDGKGQPAITHFEPLGFASGDGSVTLARVRTESGRKHQIRAHAQWLGHSVVGDKIYGPDPRLFLEFIEHGWTPALEERLWLPRQALHCSLVDLHAAGMPYRFESEMPEDLQRFCQGRGVPLSAL